MIEGKKRGVCSLLTGLFVVLLCFVAAPAAFAQPDVIVGALPGSNSYGTTGGTGIYAYSIATTSCNIGTTNLNWQANNANHPVIAQDMYRLKDGRLTQIGNSWLKHGFCALQNPGICPGCAGGGGCPQFLTPGCSDPYSSGLNGTQSNLGPRSQVNATTGVFPFPYSAPPFSGTIMRRMQVHVDDINAAQNPGALYFVSGYYVALDDAIAGNQANNASYRQVTVGQTGNRSLSMLGSTQMQQPAIQAWQDFQPTVTLVDVQAAGDGLFIVGYDVIDNGNGTWSYEYAVYNMFSDRGGQSFSVPVPGGVTLSNVGFHDNSWHSGEPYSDVDWAVTTTPGLGITWATDTFATNSNANAIRWSQMYNFYFTADSPPENNTGTLGLFKTGATNSLDFTISAPSGNFLAAVTGLTCIQMTSTASTALLNWSNPLAYDGITIARNGVTIANLAGGATSFTDTNPGFGINEYTVSGSLAGDSAFGVPCTVDSAPLAPAGTSCSQPDPQLADTTFGWSNGMTYDSVNVYLDGAFETSLAGTATSYSNSGLSFGLHTYQVGGVIDGTESDRTDCIVDVLAPPPLGFTLRAMNGLGNYDPGTGIGFATLSVMIEEDSANAGYPNPVRGMSVSMTYDAALLQATTVDEGATLGPVEFFEKEIVTGGFTIGVVVDFGNLTTISLLSTIEVASVSFVTNAGALAGNATGATALVQFTDGLGSGAPVDNIVVVDFAGVIPAKVDGQIDLSAGGAIFRRGDTNNDSQVNIADAISTLNYLFSAGPATCLDSLDINDDGTPNIADAIILLGFLFSGTAAPAAPFPGCGSDGTADVTECDSYTGGC